MKTPVFSVIIPTYNRASLVAEAIGSVLAQTCDNYEIIVMDDGSTDDTREVVGRFEVAHGGCVRYLHQKNQGKSVALNNALPHARGEFIAFLDSDDSWLPELLEWQMRAITQFGSQYPCFTDATYVNNPHLQMTAFEFAGRKYEQTLGMIDDPLGHLLGSRSGIYMQTMALHRSLLERAGEFDSKLKVGQDTDLLFRLALVAPRFCYVNKPLVKIDRTMNRKDGLVELLVTDESLRLQEREYLYDKLLGRSGQFQPNIRKQLRARLAEIHSEWANLYLVSRQYGKARQAMSKAVSTQLTAKAAAKLLLIAVAPSVARREHLRRDVERAKQRIIA